METKTGIDPHTDLHITYRQIESRIEYIFQLLSSRSHHTGIAWYVRSPRFLETCLHLIPITAVHQEQCPQTVSPRRVLWQPHHKRGSTGKKSVLVLLSVCLLR